MKNLVHLSLDEIEMMDFKVPKYNKLKKEQFKRCKECKGSGALVVIDSETKEEKAITCPRCGGEGII